jgi:DNA-binding LytR/AlgR family response regulator
MDDFTHYNKICLKTVIGVEFIICSDILYFSIFKNHVEVIFVNGRRLRILHSLKELEINLSELMFYRCHNNCLVNINHIIKYINKTGELYLNYDTFIVVAKDRRSEFNKIFTKQILI